MPLVLIFIISIIIANLLTTYFAAEFPQITAVNAFIFIGLDLSIRDKLHENWNGKKLKRNMFFLIVCGAVATFLLNTAALWVCVGSVVAFSAALIVDSVLYHKYYNLSFLKKSNISNVGGAISDSFFFVIIALHFLPIQTQFKIIFLNIAAKVAGGALWSVILNNPAGKSKL